MAFILYDVETSGLNRRFDQILQFAAVRTDVGLVETDRFETRSRLMPHIVPSPKALQVTGLTLADANSAARQSHYGMVCEIASTLAAWCPAIFLGFNSIRFDEEFLRQAFYQCLHPVFLTNTNGNARADVLNLMRAATSLHPSVIKPGEDDDGRPSHRLGPLAAANGIFTDKLHDANADVDAMLALCRMVRAGAPDLWSNFLRFSSKAAVLDLVRDEEAFAYFDYFGTPRVMHFLTRVGVSPNDPNAHYCLDLTCDVDALRKLDADELSERMKQEPRPVRRLKVNGSPLLYQLWDIDPERFGDTSEDELTRTASSVRADVEFMAALTAAAASVEPVYAASEHVELQIYGGNFFSDVDRELCQRFHGLPWERRAEIVGRFGDQRLRRLARRLIYFESPNLLDEANRRVIADDIAARRRGAGVHVSPPWTTIAQAIAELETMGGDVSDAFRASFLELL
ncbi:exonuclease domain-containing protein [Bradyrhizobium brasilense]|uniref:exonuclease domain-containing protein n=1 Tax=Bradyrhizobium brasilense TaxID=1419277 RepID=UPI0028772947|nr:exonuclease domain-containing protein [Bradyrhizobium brasilense]MCP3414246.1 exonuclease domain-containing protein [Bradyrhizobium brasilense]